MPKKKSPTRPERKTAAQLNREIDAALYKPGRYWVDGKSTGFQVDVYCIQGEWVYVQRFGSGGAHNPLTPEIWARLVPVDRNEK